MILVSIYDDLVVVSNHNKVIEKLKENLSKTFEMWDLENLPYCLGIKIQKTTTKSQCHCQTIVMIYWIDSTWRIGNQSLHLLSFKGKLSLEMSPETQCKMEEVKIIPYQNLIGALMYLTVATRSDIGHAVSGLGHYISNFGLKHWTLDIGLVDLDNTSLTLD